MFILEYIIYLIASVAIVALLPYVFFGGAAIISHVYVRCVKRIFS